MTASQSYPRMTFGPVATRKTAMSAAVLAAAIATALSAQGMVSVGMDNLRMSAAVAIGLTIFLEAALLASALLARAAVLAGRTGRTDSMFCWACSILSGAFSAAHEFVRHSGDSTAWDLSPGALLAAAVRLAAPAVACFVWHRVMTADAAEVRDMPTWQQHRRTTAMRRLALAALAVEQLSQHGDRSESLGKAARKLTAAHKAYLSRVDPTDPDTEAELNRWFAAVGARATFAARTRQPMEVGSAEAATPALAATVAALQDATEDVAPVVSATEADAPPPVETQTPAPVENPLQATPKKRPMSAIPTEEKLSAALAALAANPAMTGTEMADTLADTLHTTCRERTGYRWLEAARAASNGQPTLVAVG